MANRGKVYKFTTGDVGELLQSWLAKGKSPKSITVRKTQPDLRRTPRVHVELSIGDFGDGYGFTDVAKGSGETLAQAIENAFKNKRKKR
jgi:hypothetical protein